jgi:hypothetical protein
LKRIQRLCLAAAIPWLWAGAIHAEGPDAADEAASTAHAAAMIPLTLVSHGASLAGADTDPRLPPWLPEQLEVRKGAGLAFTRPVRMGATNLQLGVAGPVVRKRNLGLAVEVRF